jgi:hypothetical protein
MSRALVLCHPKNLNDDLSGHFLGELFKQIQSEYSPDVSEYHTADILDIRGEKLFNELHTKHFIADVWSNDFIKSHKNEYDLVFMPDASGIWYTDVLENEHFEKNLEEIIDKTMALVSDQGILMLGKFFDQHQKFIISRYKNATLKKISDYNIPYFIFDKTQLLEEKNNLM